MLTTILTHALAVLVGFGGGWWACQKYAAKAAAELAAVKKVL
jgi:hypothetical protein